METLTKAEEKSKATTLRIVSAILWVFAIAFEVLAILFLFQKLYLPLEELLRTLTTSPAKRLGKEGVKGCLKEGADADLVAFDSALQITDVIAMGKLALRDGELKMRGTFEA